ncbi:MAG TPA: acyltransferase domain-containing protein, partial [Candidatus Limnocylindrales bacterium]
MAAIAYVFPGQGSQVVGMGRDLAAAQPVAAAVFATADEALGEPISRLAWEGPAEDLNRTENAQPALVAASIAYFDALDAQLTPAGVIETIPKPRFIAGHSMGQYSAAVAAGAIRDADAIRLVRERGRLMQSSGSGRDGAMAAVLGLDDAAIPELTRRASAHGV